MALTITPQAEFGDKIPADKKGPIETALAELKEAHKNQDVAAIDKATETLNAAWTAASADIYNTGNQPGAEQPGGPQGGGFENADKKGDEHVADAEFEEVK